MGRIHFFEFEDQAWLPRSIHSGITAFLQFAVSRIDLYRPVAPLLDRALERSGAQQVLDLCSGAGGPWLEMRRHLEMVRRRRMPVCLTDYFPDPETFRRLQASAPGTFTCVDAPVSALDVPARLTGFRTLFSAFHHFREDEAVRIIASAVAGRQGLGVMESTQRHPLLIAYMLLTPFMVWLTAPFHRGADWKRMFWTYLVPAIPLMVMFDGIVSCLRTYTPEELLALAARVPGSEGYHWEAGVRRLGILPVGTTYLLGWPREAEAAPHSPPPARS